jgi:hypothetical protein
LVAVTVSKENTQKALDSCKETLNNLRKSQPITPDNVESVRRVVLNQHDFQLRTTPYWTEQMAGLQEESIPLKGPLSFTDFQPVVEAMTAKDLQLTLETWGLDEDQLYTAIGRTVQPEGVEEPEDDILRTAPSIGMRRGGALKG